MQQHLLELRWGGRKRCLLYLQNGIQLKSGSNGERKKTHTPGLLHKHFIEREINTSIGFSQNIFDGVRLLLIGMDILTTLHKK